MQIKNKIFFAIVFVLFNVINIKELNKTNYKQFGKLISKINFIINKNQEDTKKEIDKINFENIKLQELNNSLKKDLEEIYKPFNDFINNNLAKYDWQNSQHNLNDVLVQEKKIVNLKAGVQLKKIIYKYKECAKETINLIAIHGTMSSWDIFGNSDTASSLVIRDFAKEIAIIYGKKVKLTLINWGGFLSQKRRIKVGQILAKYIAKKNKNNSIIWAMGHSHGCNVINNMAESLKKYGKVIDCAIFIAPIALDINPCANDGLNIKECFNFYSHGDIMQAFGSKQNGESKVKFFPSCPQTKSYCVEIYPNNEEVDHLTIKIVVLEQLLPLMCIIKKDFPLATDLNAILFQDHNLPIITLNDKNKNPDYNNFVNKFFNLNQFQQKINEQKKISEQNIKDLNDKLNQPLFKSHSRIDRFLKGCKAIINQRPRYPWRHKNNNKPE